MHDPLSPRRLARLGLLPAALMTMSAAASAHIVFEQKQAPAGSYYKGALMVGHGCNGSATRAITVTIPEGVQGAHPQPRPAGNSRSSGRRWPSPCSRTAS